MSRLNEYLEAVSSVDISTAVREFKSNNNGNSNIGLFNTLIELASRENVKIFVNDKSIWNSPVGNPSGLHDFANELIRNKWKKSGPSFLKKLLTIKSGDVIEVKDYVNVTRDRGRWETYKKWSAK